MKELKYTLTTSTGAEVLDISPDGYDDSSINISRGTTYWGVFRKWTIPLKFVKRGAYLVRYELYTKGMRGVVGLKIEKLNKVTDQYYTVYEGTADPMTFKDYDNYIEVSFFDAGLAYYVKQNSGNEYQLDHVDFITKTITYSGNNYDAINFYDLIKALLDKMTDGKITDGTYLFKSDLLGEMGQNVSGYTGNARQYVITNGVNLCNPGVSVTSGNYYTISLDNLLKTINVFAPCSYSIEIDPATGKQQFRVESPSHVFDESAAVVDLGDVSMFSAYIDKTLSAGKLEIGWPGGEDDPDIVIYEPMAKSTWQLPNLNNETKLELVATIRADSTEIRRIISEVDVDSANEMFILELKPDYTWNSDNTGQITSDTPPTAFSLYNGTLAPRNCALRHIPFLSSLCWNYSGVGAVFMKGENRLKDTAVKLYNEGSFTNEYTDLPLTYPEYFYPIIFEIEIEVRNDLIVLLNNLPTGRFRFNYKDNTYEGWLKDVTFGMYQNSTTKIKLLAATGFGNIIYNLIR